MKSGCQEKIHREIPVLESLSTVKCVQAVRLATLLKRHPRTGVSETAVRRFSTKQVFLNNSQNLREAFLKIPFLTKHLHWLLLTVSRFQPAALLKKRLGQKCLFVNFEKFFRSPLLYTTSGKLLISFTSCRISTTTYSKQVFHMCFQAFYTRRSSYSKAFMYSKSLQIICEEVNL